jgi:hypothetical protein
MSFGEKELRVYILRANVFRKNFFAANVFRANVFRANVFRAIVSAEKCFPGKGICEKMYSGQMSS